jgi:8-hydroxy-5-deazaflavin:NADPH oxidoreductase
LNVNEGVNSNNHSIEQEIIMNIAILGTGNMALGLAKLFAGAGYGVVVGARDVAKARTFASALGPDVQAGSLADAARQADVVVLAVPYGAAGEAIAAAGGLAGKTVVDISNPLTADYMGLTVGHTTSAAEEIQKLAPDAVIVKAFNTIFAQVLQGGGKAAGQAVTVFLAGDSDVANETVAAIVRKIGLVAVQTGGLVRARYLEPLAGLNIVLGYGKGHGTDIAPTWIFGPQKTAA